MKLFLLFFLTVLLLTHTVVFSSSANSRPPPDLRALLSLKSSVRGGSAVFANWNATAAEYSGGDPVWCAWSGVKCDPETDNVVSLQLSSQNPSGLIPSDFGYLYHLTDRHHFS